MKKIFSYILILILINNLYSQEDINEIKIDLVKWETKRRVALTFDDFLTFSNYNFKISDEAFNCLFLDYKTLIEEICSGNRIMKNDKKALFLNSRVEFAYKTKKIILFFDIYGNYFFNGIKYQKNCCLYYSLFKYFSDELIPTDNLEECAKEIKASRN